MGGTSTDVCLVVSGVPSVSPETEVDGLPIRTPVLDIVSVGAGGGSLVWIDDGGMLRVGPRSAGANPGPACYGRGGTQPTVTDAHVVRGTIRPDAFLGGTMPLDTDKPIGPSKRSPRSSERRSGKRLRLRSGSRSPISYVPCSSSRPSAAAIRANTRSCRSAAPARCSRRRSRRSSACARSWSRPTRA
jgi:hypothetical protein